MDDEGGGATRKRVSTACEACRATKIRCRPSEQPGVCAKCLASKRECVSRTGPRTRRSRKAQIAEDDAAQPRPTGSPSTFSIDFAVSANAEIDEGFETLRDAHELFVDNLLHAEGYSDMSQWTPSAMGGIQTPPASSTHSQSIQDFQGKPTFNLSSAASLLESFRSMLTFFPCIVLPPDASVPHLAATRPFVLLAILAAASGSKTLQGHSLYDDEFRKVLGLKFVAGGERSLELLQGILIYCAWYPFHLRPRNKQAMQYIRMAADLVNDLELDQEFAPDVSQPEREVTDEQLDGIRAYTGYCYLATTFVVVWKKSRGVSTSFTPWTYTCCDILERYAQEDGDAVLAALLRSSSILFQAADAIHERNLQKEQYSRLILGGLELQLNDFKAQLPDKVASLPPVELQVIFVEFYLAGGPLLKLPRSTSPVPAGSESLPPVSSKLRDATVKVRKFFDSYSKLTETDILCFTLNDWARLVLAVVLALRLSFPAPECPDFDTAWARSHLRFDEFLDQVCREQDLTPASRKVDVLSASRVIMEVVKGKYQRRLQALEASQASTPGRSLGCPMLDGSLGPYYPIWDAAFAPMAMPQPAAGSGETNKPVFHDLWATMTMSWADEDGTAEGQQW